MDWNVILLGLWLFAGCASLGEEPPREYPEYGFFTAGHAYGPADSLLRAEGLWTPFWQAITKVNDDPRVDFGVFTGDFVHKGTHEQLVAFEAARKTLRPETFVVPGNHELLWNTMHEPYDSLYAETPFVRYYAREVGGDLHLFLDPNVCNWGICREQLDWFRAKLDEADAYRRIFIFVHQVMWWEADTASPYHGPIPNSQFSRDTIPQFHTEILSMLKATRNPVYCIAGDIGAFCVRPFASWITVGNVNLIANGMGCERNSWYLRAQVPSNGPPRFWLEGVGIHEGDTLPLEDFHETLKP